MTVSESLVKMARLNKSHVIHPETLYRTVSQQIILGFRAGANKGTVCILQTGDKLARQLDIKTQMREI